MIVADAHCHLDDPSFDWTYLQATLTSLCQDQPGLKFLCLNAGYSPERSRQGWSTLDEAEVKTAFPHSLSIKRALGIHPWLIRDWRKQNAECNLDELVHQALDELSELLKEHRDEVCALGEMGLDRAKADDAPACQAQQELFLGQLELAKSNDLPAIIHCVKAQGLLQETLQKCHWDPRERPTLLHGFRQHPQNLPRYLKQGFYISLSPYYLQDCLKCEDVCQTLPLERMLLESDCPSTIMKSPMEIPRWAAALARNYGISSAEMMERCTANLLKFLGGTT